MRIQPLLLVLWLVSVLSACSSGTSAIMETVQAGLRREGVPDNVRLNPAFRYLRVTVDKRTAFLALGYVEGELGRRTEVWYSGEREVVRLQQGRLVGATGAAIEWRNVMVPELLPWSTIARSNTPIEWARVRDVMPGYRYGVRDSLSLRAVPAPARSALQRLDPGKLRWFEEKSLTQAAGGRAAEELDLPPARYAVDLSGGNEVVVYGEQCLAREFCFTWQRWPVEVQGAVSKQ